MNIPLERISSVKPTNKTAPRDQGHRNMAGRIKIIEIQIRRFILCYSGFGGLSWTILRFLKKVLFLNYLYLISSVTSVAQNESSYSIIRDGWNSRNSIIQCRRKQICIGGGGGGLIMDWSLDRTNEHAQRA